MPSFLVSDHEYTLNGGTTWQPVTEATLSVLVGNISKAIGQVGFRVKATATRPAGLPLFNNVPFSVQAATPTVTASDQQRQGQRYSFLLDPSTTSASDFEVVVNYTPPSAAPQFVPIYADTLHPLGVYLSTEWTVADSGYWQFSSLGPSSPNRYLFTGNVYANGTNWPARVQANKGGEFRVPAVDSPNPAVPVIIFLNDVIVFNGLVDYTKVDTVIYSTGPLTGTNVLSIARGGVADGNALKVAGVYRYV